MAGSRVVAGLYKGAEVDVVKNLPDQGRLVCLIKAKPEGCRGPSEVGEETVLLKDQVSLPPGTALPVDVPKDSDAFDLNKLKDQLMSGGPDVLSSLMNDPKALESLMGNPSFMAEMMAGLGGGPAPSAAAPVPPAAVESKVTKDQPSKPPAKLPEGVTREMGKAFLDAAKACDLKTVKEMVTKTPALASYSGAGTSYATVGHTALHWFSAKGSVEGVKHLITNVGVDKHIRNQFDSTPLHSASVNGQLDVVKVLVDLGCDAGLKDEAGETPSDVAAHRQQHQVISFLKSRK